MVSVTNTNYRAAAPMALPSFEERSAQDMLVGVSLPIFPVCTSTCNAARYSVSTRSTDRSLKREAARKGWGAL